MYFENPHPHLDEGHRYHIEESLVKYLYMEEQREIHEAKKEYGKRYYAERNYEVRNNFLKARREELSDDAFRNRHEDRPEVRARTTIRTNTETSTATATPTTEKKRTRGKRLFDSAGLILLYCQNCNKSKPKINYHKETNCKDCNGELKFQCINCDLIYKSHMACVAHIKFKHPDAKSQP